jgi:hypothetical protein
LLLLVAGHLLPVFALAAAVSFSVGPGDWPYVLQHALTVFDERFLPLLVGGLVAVTALRQRSRMMWPLIGIALVAILGGGMFDEIALHTGEHRSLQIQLGLRYEDLFTTFWGRSLETAVLNLLLILAPYLALRQRTIRTA